MAATARQDNALLGDAQWLGEIIFDTIPADGVGVYLNGAEFALRAWTPDKGEFRAIVATLNRLAASQVFTTDHIAGLLPGAERYAAPRRGPFGRTPVAHATRLCGAVPAANGCAPYGGRATRRRTSSTGAGTAPAWTPRKSFEEWSELVKGKAAPFTAAERRVAETLRVALLEVVLRLADSVGEERQRAHEQQELLIAELNHRVRNILALIRGLVAQSRRDDLDGKAFVATLDDRIQALARAHDQITADRWGPARLIDLIETESGAYLGEKRDRIRLSGPNVLIDPTAFTVLALVMHELLHQRGQVRAPCPTMGRSRSAGELDEDGSLFIEWRESGAGRR